MSKHNTSIRIYQGLIKVVFGTKGNTTYKWFRVSRRNFNDLASYWQRQPNFYYAKIYEIRNYQKTKKGSYSNHNIGSQIGYITLKGSLLSPLGLNETTQSQDYKNRRIK